MNKKIINTVWLVLAIAFVFAMSASAATAFYYDVDGSPDTPIFRCEYDEAKVITSYSGEFAKTNENLKIKGGYYDGNVVDVDTVVALSKISSRDILIARMLGSFNSPITSLAIALNEIRKQKEEQAC